MVMVTNRAKGPRFFHEKDKMQPTVLLPGESRDLDLVTPRGDLRRVRRLLAARGYAVVRDWRPTTLTLRDPDGREVDLHLVDPTPDGGGDQVLDGGGVWHYGPPVTGTVGGRPAPCAPAEEQLALHQGCDPRPVDVADVALLNRADWSDDSHREGDDGDDGDDEGESKQSEKKRRRLSATRLRCASACVCAVLTSRAR